MLSVKKTRSHTRLLALHSNPRFVFSGGHFLTLPSHNNGTKIEMDNDQSYAAQLHVSKAFLVVVWLSYLQTRPAHQRYHHPPCFQGPRARDCFQCHLLESPVLQADTGPSERITSHDSPVLGSKTETLPLWSKTNPSTTMCHLSDCHQRSSTVDFSALDGH